MFARGLAFVFLSAALAVGLATAISSAGGARGAWKRFLPADDYKALVHEEMQNIRAAVGKDDFDVVQRGKVAALMIAGYTLSARDADANNLAVRAAALKLAEVLGEKDRVDEARKLAESIAALKGSGAAAPGGADFRKYVTSKLALMVMYMPKDKGGSGLPPALQLSPRLKGSQEYIENLFSYLAKRPLRKDQLAKAAADLRRLGYRTAVSGEIIASYAPDKKTKKRDPAVWHKTSADMIASSLDLAHAAEKQDAAGVQQASSRLIDSCVQCHKMFQ